MSFSPVHHSLSTNSSTYTFTSTTAGNLLILAVSSFAQTASGTISGWTHITEVTDGINNYMDVWYYPNNPGGITTVTFPVGLSAGVAMGSEWSSVATSSPLDVQGQDTSLTLSSTPAGWSTTTPSSGVKAASGDLGYTVICNGYLNGTVSDPTASAGSGTWTALDNETDANDFMAMASYYETCGASGSTETVHLAASDWGGGGIAGLLITFKASGGGPVVNANMLALMGL